MCVIILICILVFFPVHDSVSDSGVGSGWSSVGSSRSGVGSGVSVVYNTATPIHCDCVITAVKSCYLSYLSRVGCAIAKSSFVNVSMVGISSYV